MVIKRKYGDREACGLCGQDIEWCGRNIGWRDRGGNSGCVPFTRRGEVFIPLSGTKHKPFAGPVATLIPVLIEVGGRGGYRWVNGRKVLTPNGNEIQPYMRPRDARAHCKAEGWEYVEATQS